jgi:hypothetical protein
LSPPGSLTATEVATVDGTTKKRASSHPDDRAGSAVATVIQRTSDESTDGPTDD